MNKSRKIINFLEKENSYVDDFDKILSLYGFSPFYKTPTKVIYRNNLGHQLRVGFEDDWIHLSKEGNVLFSGKGVEDLRNYLETTYGGFTKDLRWKVSKES